MTQSFLDFTLPISGRHPRARHASASGAVHAQRTRGALQAAYLDLLRASGPLSDPEAAQLLARPLSSICSTRNGCKALVVPSDQWEETAYRTKRVKWRLTQEG